MTRVLLVDDEPNLTWTMAQFLSRQGYETETASDYESAVGILGSKKFDVAIVDIILPGKSGIELLKRIAECDQSVSVVLMTGQPDVERIPEILRSGACDYLQKPVVKDTLIKAVSDAVDNKRRAEEKLLNDETVRNRAAHLEALLKERTGETTRAAAQIAHEVKNPLAGLHLYSAHLRSKMTGRADKGQIELVDKIINTLNHLSGVVEKTLDFSRPMHLTLARVDLRQVTREALRLVEPQLAAAGVALRRAFPTIAMPCQVDESYIRQALVNILLNAIEAATGEREVNVILGREGGPLTVEVIDRGRGISEEQLTQIFEPFYTTKAKGLGLGLPFAKRVIEAHQGTITIESRPRRGTRVIVRLPAESGS